MGLRSAYWWWPFGQVPEIKPGELAARLQQQSLQLLDVRTRTEYERGHIPSAQSVPITEFRRRLPELSLDREQPVIAICLSAHRSVPAVRMLWRHGYAHACQLGGGMLAWRRENLPEET